MSPARVLVDATAIPPDRGGVGRYVDGLLHGLVTAGHRVAVIARPRDAARWRDAGLDVVVAPAWVGSTALRLLWEQVALPRVVRRGGYDVLHSPHYTHPLAGRFGRVVTIHDLTFFTLPALHSRLKASFFRFWLRRLARRSIPVIAVSEATASEYRRLLGPDPATITVAPHGYDEATFRPPRAEDVDAFRATLAGTPPTWIAFLGTLEPRKNVPALVRAYERLPPDAPPLLLAGGAGWDAEVAPAVDRAVANGRDVRLLGYLPLEHLSAFLGGAEVVAYPSLGEGFGLPVLEAMAAGACVLTSDELALPEVGGDAVVYSGTTDAELAETLAGLLADPGRRADLGARAAERARRFTWSESAERHLGAYREAAR
jgi:Glycosyltransferase